MNDDEVGLIGGDIQAWGLCVRVKEGDLDECFGQVGGTSIGTRMSGGELERATRRHGTR